MNRGTSISREVQVGEELGGGIHSVNVLRLQQVPQLRRWI
jgi:hypothetical protein